MDTLTLEIAAFVIEGFIARVRRTDHPRGQAGHVRQVNGRAG